MTDMQSQGMLVAVEQLLTGATNGEGYRHTIFDVPEGRCAVFIGVPGAHVSYPGIMMLGQLNDGTYILDMHFDQAPSEQMCATRSWRVIDGAVESLMVQQNVPEPFVVPGQTDNSYESIVLLGMNIERMAAAPNTSDPAFLVSQKLHRPAQFIDKETTYTLQTPAVLLALLALGNPTSSSDCSSRVVSWLEHGYHPLTVSYARQLQSMAA